MCLCLNWHKHTQKFLREKGGGWLGGVEWVASLPFHHPSHPPSLATHSTPRSAPTHHAITWYYMYMKMHTWKCIQCTFSSKNVLAWRLQMQPREQSNRQCNAYMQYHYLVYVLVSVRQLLYQGFTKFQCWRKSREEPRGRCKERTISFQAKSDILEASTILHISSIEC